MLLHFSIFNKSNQLTLEARELPKGVHLLDDSEIEDSHGPLGSNLPLPTSHEPIPVSRTINENSALLTRYIFTSHFILFIIIFVIFVLTGQLLIWCTY